MINLNKHRIDFGKGDVGIGVIGNTTDSAQLAFYNQSARPIHILKESRSESWVRTHGI